MTQQGSGSPAAPDDLTRAMPPTAGNHSHTGEHHRPPRSDEPRPSTTGQVDYDTPGTYTNLDDRHDAQPGTRRRSTGRSGQHELSRSTSSTSKRPSRMTRRQSSSARQVDYDIPDQCANLDDAAASPPVQNPDEAPVYRHTSLEATRHEAGLEEEEERQRRRRESRRNLATGGRQPGIPDDTTGAQHSSAFQVSRLATQLYTISYLIFFSILGTLARLGLQALTYYPGAPVMFSSIWPNFAGSLVMGFLAEDRMLFSQEWGIPSYEEELKRARAASGKDEETSGSDSAAAANLAAAKKAYAATKKTIPLYIGLATGFCGSFTSFSSFVRDVFLALSNDLASPDRVATIPRNGGYSFMALLAVIILTISLALSGLFLGAHLAIATEPCIPALPFRFMRRLLDRSAVFLGWGCWIGAVVLSAVPPDRNNNLGAEETWRGRATFALVFAPLGCLARFYASLYLNGKIASFPLGTFTVNVFGSAVLAMAWALAHVPLGGVVGCQVLQGVEDGFCGCLTTVSTWVAELSSLRRRHAYTYGAASVLVSVAFMVAIMGGLRWSDGFAEVKCSH